VEKKKETLLYFRASGAFESLNLAIETFKNFLKEEEARELKKRTMEKFQTAG
jgi:hypothetical protein